MKKVQALVLGSLFLIFGSNAEVLLEVEIATKVRFLGVQNKQYQVFATTNAAGDWQAIGEPQVGNGSIITFFHNTRGDQKLFFKVEETENPNPTGSGTPLFLLQRARLNLDGQDLSGFSLTNLNLNNFSFVNAKLDGADLRGSNLKDTRLGGASFRNANLWGADLSGARGPNADFSGADLRGAKLATGVGAKFIGANLEGIEIVGNLDFSGDIFGATVRGIKATGPAKTIFLQNANGLDFSGSDFSQTWVVAGMSFENANLTGVKFVNAEFSFNFGNPGDPVPEELRVRFNGANLTDADLTGATRFYEAPGITFRNTKMPDGSIRNN